MSEDRLTVEKYGVGWIVAALIALFNSLLIVALVMGNWTRVTTIQHTLQAITPAEEKRIETLETRQNALWQAVSGMVQERQAAAKAAKPPEPKPEEVKGNAE